MGRRYTPPLRANLFEDRQYLAWVVAENPWQKVLEVRALPAGTDLMRVFIAELLRYQDDGWRLNDFSSFSSSFFCTKEHHDKRRVYITTVDPAAPRVPLGNLM